MDYWISELMCTGLVVTVLIAGAVDTTPTHHSVKAQVAMEVSFFTLLTLAHQFHLSIGLYIEISPISTGHRKKVLQKTECYSCSFYVQDTRQ
jgi:hypothetical protein